MTAQSFVNVLPVSSLTPSQLLESAYVGDLQHKLALHSLFGSRSHPRLLELQTAVSQAAYLRAKRPDLVPPNNPNGTPPNDHTVSTAFEHFYHVDSAFVTAYLIWVVRTNAL